MTFDGAPNVHVPDPNSPDIPRRLRRRHSTPASLYAAARTYFNKPEHDRAWLTSKRFRLILRIIALEERLQQLGSGAIPPQVMLTMRLLADFNGGVHSNDPRNNAPTQEGRKHYRKAKVRWMPKDRTPKPPFGSKGQHGGARFAFKREEPLDLENGL